MGKSLYKMNPAQAYKMGYEAGLKESNIQGYMAATTMMVLSYYNVIDEHVKTHRTQCSLVKAFEAEMNRLFLEEFKDIDHIAVAIERVNFVRKHYGMEPIVWDMTKPQAVTTAKNANYKRYLGC